MNNILNYYYGLKDIDIIPLENNYLIMDNNDYTYLFFELKKDININNIISILNKLTKPNNYNDILINKDNNYISSYDNKNYILMMVKGIINEEVSLKEMINNNLKYRYLRITKNNIKDTWSKKIDYLEYQISQLSKNKSEVINSFSFFIGLAENAIEFINVNNINFNNINQSLVHYRLSSHPLMINYYNPLDILIDYEIRDYAEYIKAKLLTSDDCLNDFKYILDNANLSIDDIKLLYARLMFPTNYFDAIEDILIDNDNESNLDIYIDNVSKYINLLKDIYYEIKKSIYIDIPNWIKTWN